MPQPENLARAVGHDAEGQVDGLVAHHRDQTGAKATQTDALARSVGWRYDAAGRPISRTLPDGQQERFEYDLDGQLVAHSSFGGQRIAHAYDTAGRPTTRVTPAIEATAGRIDARTYDAEGRRLTRPKPAPTPAKGKAAGATTREADQWTGHATGHAPLGLRPSRPHHLARPHVSTACGLRR